MSSGCGCKDVYRFPHITYPYSSCTSSFLQQHPYFLFLKKNVFRSLVVIFAKNAWFNTVSFACLRCQSQITDTKGIS